MTIQDVIAAEGPRLPDVDHSQRNFNIGIVVVVAHGQSPSHELIERANGIRQQWIEYDNGPSRVHDRKLTLSVCHSEPSQRIGECDACLQSWRPMRPHAEGNCFPVDFRRDIGGPAVAHFMAECPIA